MKRVCKAAVCLAVAANATTASEGAKAWLTRHPAVQQDELTDLKNENPDAYAIVKALLTKRSLGLLDPKHPTASFAAGPPKQEEPQLSGAAAYAKFATPAELASVGKSVTQVDAVDDSGAVEAPVVSHHVGGWLNWKPSESAVDDDALVDSIAGGAPSTPKKSLLSQGREEQSAFAKDEDLLAPDMPAAAPVAQAAAPVVVAAAPVVAAAAGGNPYLDGLDLGAPAQPTAKKTAMAATNSQPNYLASFSWGDDEAATKPQAAPKQRLLQKKQTQAQAAPKQSDNAFMSWLGGGSKAAAAPAMAAVAAPAAPAEQNPYTAGLW